MLEQVFWFSTFPINNTLYYINEGLLKNPDILRLEMDMMEQSYNTNGLSYDQVRNSSYLTRQMLSGNIRLYWGKDTNGNIILKTGSSLFDFFKLMCDPVGEMKDRLNPFLSVLFGESSLSELNPLDTPLYYAKEQLAAIKNPKKHSLLPSIYAVLNQNNNYTYRYNYPVEYRARTWKTYPKHYYPKHDSYKQIAYKFSRNRYLWAKSTKSNLLSYYSKGVLPYWYNDFDYKRALGRLRRQNKKGPML